ncbi:MAG: hypothetical protein U0235_13995 [Polyangiaceae bacterium]
MAPKLALAPVALAVALASQTARAEAPSLDARTFRPATDPRGGLSLEPADVMPAWSFGATSLVHYSYRPVTVRRADTGDVFARPIEHVVGGDFGFAFAIPNVQLGASLPYVFAQTGDKGLPGAVSSTARAPLAAIGDLALEAKSPILTYTTAGLGVGLRGRVTLPTGERTSFAGSGTTSVDLHSCRIQSSRRDRAREPRLPDALRSHGVAARGAGPSSATSCLGRWASA